jgi:pyruvate dehydrogenase E1 component
LVTRLLSNVGGPVIAVTDYMRLVPDQVSRWVPGPFTTLGTDGFGRSDARKALRRFFEVDAGHIVAATLSTLAGQGAVAETVVKDAFDRYDIDPEAPDPAVSR